MDKQGVKMSYTKGEWKIYTDSMTCATDIVAEDGIGFFTEVVAHIRRANKNYEDNAHLIASAPAMYKACKLGEQLAEELLKITGYSTIHCLDVKDSLEEIRKALAKAENGEENG